MPIYYNQDESEVLDALQVQADDGLTPQQVQQRRAEYGPNALPVGEETSILKLLISQFTDLMVILLIVAALISLFIGEIRDAVVILVIVTLNALIGLYQEYSAEKAIEALSAMQVPRVRVRRGGEVEEINANELVPGDIVLLEEGDSVPADGRVIRSTSMMVEEAALTGESNAVTKETTLIASTEVALGDRKNMVFMGTSVTSGRGAFVVTATGLKTQIGQIAEMLSGVEDAMTPLQKRLDQLGKLLAGTAVVVVFIVFAVGVARGIDAQEMFLTAVSLAVAAVPESLMALVTISLSLGANRMVKRNALIRRLPAVETLGSVTTICTDKTGTLTRNEMTATNMAIPYHPDVNISGVGYTSEGQFYNRETNELIAPNDDIALSRVVKCFALSTNAFIEDEDGDRIFEVIGDTTEAALLVAAHKVGWSRDGMETSLPRLGEVPLTSERKAMSTLHAVKGDEARELFPDGEYVLITKGAPDRLIGWAAHEWADERLIPLSDARRQQWQAKVDGMARDGLRVLGLAFRGFNEQPEMKPEVERELAMLGLVGILDPARPEAKEAIAVAKGAGIRTVMITGDHVLTAEAIARDLGIIDEAASAVKGSAIDRMDEAQLRETLKHTSAFARVAPEHKLRIVKALQSTGQVVSMTGDGVNDAPALKQADIGVAMGITGTDVSKGASDMVLTDDNFTSIVSAVEEGRVVYDNIRKFLRYVLSSNIGEILVMFAAIIAGLKVPMLAIQILWVNLLTDGLPAIALGFESGEEDVMERPPRDPEESILAQGTGLHIALIGTLIGALSLIGFLYGHSAYSLDPLSESLGLEQLDSAALARVVGEDHVVEGWDALSTEDRLAVVLPTEGEETGDHEEGGGDGLLDRAERVPRTIAFSVLALAQIFQVMGIHPGDHRSFFRVGFRGAPLLMWATLASIVLQVAVIYLPFMQPLLDTVALPIEQLVVVFALAITTLFAVELKKLIFRPADA